MCVHIGGVPCRVCLVNSAGNVLLDRYVRPQERVTDFRTKVSGESRVGRWVGLEGWVSV
jgi:hypothetical protein